jgi:hypothetical protein
MKRCLLLALVLLSTAAFAQTNVRVRGTITGLQGDVLSVKSREGKDLKLQLAPDAAVFTAKPATLAELNGTYVGCTAKPGPDGRLVAMEVHSISPQVPAGHIPWDLAPETTMTNANLTGVAKAQGGSEITLQYKDGMQKVIVPPGTPVVGFVQADRSALEAGETIFAGARQEADGRLLVQRVQVSKDGVRPPH